MTKTIEGYSPLPKESFIEAEWRGPEGWLEGVSPRWQGYTADLPVRGETILYPLRESNFGEVLPHIYQNHMWVEEESSRGLGPLGRIHLLVNNLYDLNGSHDYDEATNQFLSLQGVLSDGSYGKKPKIAAQLTEVFEKYKDIREVRLIKAAKALTSIIDLHELYVVASDDSEQTTPDNERHMYVARLSGIINTRRDNSMNYHLVVTNPDGDKGLLPRSFSVPAGVSAPAAE